MVTDDFIIGRKVQWGRGERKQKGRIAAVGFAPPSVDDEEWIPATFHLLVVREGKFCVVNALDVLVYSWLSE